MEKDGNLISLGSFLPAAERYHLMPRIDRWVVSNMLAWLSDHKRAADATASACWGINLSGASLSDPDFCEALVTQVKAANLLPGSLCFEITESAAIAQLSRVSELITTLRLLGCRFVLDDFGTGLSSFSYLKQLPVDYLKIDGHFIRHVHQDPIDRAMVKAINSVGKTLGIATIAEFVETHETLDALKRLDIDYAQGYLWGEPVPLTQLAGSGVTLMPR